MEFAADSFTVAPSVGALLWMALIPLVLGAGVITMLKGRWGWLLIGLLTGGLLWLLTAFMAPLPNGAWDLGRRARRRT